MNKRRKPPLVHEHLATMADELDASPPRRFGYRERARIERFLFLTLKALCEERVGFVLHGLSATHRRLLQEHLDEAQSNAAFIDLVRRVFELRIFIVELSSTDPYVRHEALDRVSVAKPEVVKFVVRQLRTVANDAHTLTLEAGTTGEGDG